MDSSALQYIDGAAALQAVLTEIAACTAAQARYERADNWRGVHLTGYALICLRSVADQIEHQARMAAIGTMAACPDCGAPHPRGDR